MKKLLIISALAIAALSSCKPIDPIEEKNEYTDVVVYSQDTITSENDVTDYASIKVLCDNSSQLFQLTFSNIKLPNANPQTVTVRGLSQYLKDVTNNGQTDYLYTFFKTDGPAYTDGLSIQNLRFGWLSTVYWCTFATGQNRVWMLPNKIQTYANKNTIFNIRGDAFHENAIHPRYDFTINTAKKTVTILGRGITFQTQNDGKNNIEFRNQFSLENIPMEFNPKGFKAKAASIDPVTDGERGKYKITDFYLEFDADYDGIHEARYTLTKVSSGESFNIISTFGYNNQRNY